LGHDFDACHCPLLFGPVLTGAHKSVRGLASLLEGLSVPLGRSSLLLGRALLHKLVDIGPDGLNVLGHVGIWIPSENLIGQLLKLI
jgi:hypothetical protein